MTKFNNLLMFLCLGSVLFGSSCWFQPVCGDELAGRGDRWFTERQQVGQAGDDRADSDMPATEAAPEPIQFQAGVCWVGAADREGLAYLVERGVGWVSVTPFAYGHREKSQPPVGGYRASRFRGESLVGVSEVIDISQQLGLKVLLKPHIWFSTESAWRGDIAMGTEEDWKRWFDAYWDFLQPFVSLAAEKEVAAFCVGCELAGTIGEEKRWRSLIAQIRKVYSGQLTYAANWHDEYREIEFWDALDWMGVQAYFPLTDSKEPSEVALREGWIPWRAKLREFSRTQNRPIVFTEVGYRPEVDNAREPWKWSLSGPSEPEAQANAFRALFDVFKGEEWLAGIHVWKWFAGYSGEDRPRRRRGHDSFSPQGLPAEEVIFERFRDLLKRRESDSKETNPEVKKPAASPPG